MTSDLKLIDGAPLLHGLNSILQTSMICLFKAGYPKESLIQTVDTAWAIHNALEAKEQEDKNSAPENPSDIYDHLVKHMPPDLAEKLKRPGESD